MSKACRVGRYRYAFPDDHQVGQFSNGDFWVMAPHGSSEITIESITVVDGEEEVLNA